MCNILSEFESFDSTVGYMASACILQLHNELCSLQWHSEERIPLPRPPDLELNKIKCCKIYPVSLGIARPRLTLT